MINPLLISGLLGFFSPSVPPAVEEPPVVVIQKSWKCPECTTEEQYVLAILQEKSNINDKYALATIMGNIQQESMFKSNICEGGARVPYEKCYSGGYGLIQWTTSGRYHGLGSFCKKYDCDPSSLKGQVHYMINEPQFLHVLQHFQGRGRTVDQYMNSAYRWLGWGIHGNRTRYTYNYLNKLIWI